MPEETDDPRQAAEGELALARLALAEGDLRHAAEHLAGAIRHAPTLPEVHELLATLAARAQGGLELFPPQEHPFIGSVVARAHLLAAAGRPGDGLELLAAASHHLPTADWAGVPWVTAGGLGARLDPDQLARAVLRVCAGITDPVPAEHRAPLTPYLTVVAQGIDAHPTHGLLLGAGSALARRLGAVDLAVSWAARGVRAAPSKLAEVWLGYAYRSAGRTREALAALRRAIAHDPDDLTLYADIAGTLADHGKLDRALRWTDRALAKDPTFDCARHTASRLRYQRDGDVAHLVALVDFARDHPSNAHEHSDLAECCHDRPWLGRVPPAGEAVVNVLRQVLATGTPVAGGNLRLSTLEVPSAMRALAAGIPDVAVTVDTVPAPDIRVPRRATGTVLWRYDGTDAKPALPPPSPAAAERVRQLAQAAWACPPAAYDAAVGLATVQLADLLAVLVHPPAAPATELGRAMTRHDPALWVRSVQVYACLGLLHHRTDEPWVGSTRRRVLLELVWGVEDWITEAALFTLVTAAWVDPTVRADVAGSVAERLADIAGVGRQRPVTIAWSVARLALATPGLDAEATRLARRIVAAEEAVGGPAAARRIGARRGRRLIRWLTRR
ncbi:MAG TPA: tetratricopeptide repeat protein [Catenuloplanes sp.]